MSAAVEATDGVVRGLIDEARLKVSVVVCTEAVREGARRHGLGAVSAALLGQGVAGGLLLASLQKESTRLNLQVEVDGPLRGLFVDAGSDGDVRGYVKSPHLEVELGEGPFRWRAALGNSGFLSVLRDLGRGEFYRSSVELEHLDLARDLDEYFVSSEQVRTRVALATLRSPSDASVCAAAGALVQCLPESSPAAFEEFAGDLSVRLARALEVPGPLTPAGLLTTLFPAGCRAVATTRVAWRCTCSKERAVQTVAALGRAELQSLLDTLGSTAVTCQFCGSRYELSTQELVDLIEQLSAAEAAELKSRS